MTSSDRHQHRALSDSTAGHLVRRLERRYILVLAAVAGLILADQLLIQPMLMRLDSYAPAINVAGRQRMLSQKAAKGALALRFASTAGAQDVARAELTSTLHEWSRAHTLLRTSRGRPDAGNAKASALVQTWAELEPHFERMHAAALNLLASSDESKTRNIDVILAAEPKYLESMNAFVGLLEDEASQAVGRLRIVGILIAATILALLVALGYRVVRPATLLIRAQLDDLETRVLERTGALASANHALSQEMADREQAESRTRDLAAQLAHASRVTTMGHLTAGIAHELNQPLAAIVNYAEACDVLLAKEVRAATVRQHFDKLKEAALRSGQIVRRMRNFVRPQREALAKVDLHELIREVAALCGPEIIRRDVTLSLALEAANASLGGDAIQLQQVLVNLVQNGLEAVESRPSHLRRISIATRTVDEHVEVSVTDCGPTMPAEVFSKLFTPFQTTKAQGLGLGLCICRTIVDQHGGSIWAKADTPEGTKFCFTVPVQTSYDTADAEPADCICGR